MEVQGGKMTSQGPIAGEQQIQLQKPHPLIPRLGVILDHATYNFYA